MLFFLSLWPKCPTEHPRREDLALERKWWDMWLHNLSSQEAESPGWNGSQPVTLRSPTQRLTTFDCASTLKDATIPTAQHHLLGTKCICTWACGGKIQPSCFGEILEFGYWCGEGIGLHQEGIQSFPPCSYCGCRWPRHRSSKHLLYILNYEVIWYQLNIPKWWTQKILLEKSLKEAWVRARNPTAGGEVSYLSKLAMPLRLT